MTERLPQESGGQSKKISKLKLADEAQLYKASKNGTGKTSKEIQKAEHNTKQKETRGS